MAKLLAFLAALLAAALAALYYVGMKPQQEALDASVTKQRTYARQGQGIQTGENCGRD